MTVDRVRIVVALLLFASAWVMVAVCAWKGRGRRGQPWRGYLRGFLLIAIGVTVNYVPFLFRPPHDVKAIDGVLGVVAGLMAVAGVAVVVRAHRQARRHGPEVP
jgi:uncharacterized membrane protein HdeD (DUF308 family)